MSYTQNDEELHILRAVGEAKGHFLDIGAYDGKTFSNTYRLFELGWTGVCVEPAPSVFNALFNLHNENYPGVVCVQAAVLADKPSRMIEFYDSNGDALGTTDLGNVAKWAGYAKFRRCMVAGITLEDLLHSFIDKTYDFISIDVEGQSVELFETLVELWLAEERKSPRCVVVEFDMKDQRCIDAAAKLGLKPIHKTSENYVFA